MVSDPLLENFGYYLRRAKILDSVQDSKELAVGNQESTRSRNMFEELLKESYERKERPPNK